MAGYEKLGWDATPRTVKQRYSTVSRVKNPCYFEGINVFGTDTLMVYEQTFRNPAVRSRSFIFLRKKLVAVEIQYDVVDMPTFERKILEPLKKKLGTKLMQNTVQSDKTKENLYYIWRTKEDVVVAMYGHFKEVSPENLDWIRVTYYKKDFYDFKNAARSSLAGEGEYMVFY